jgi:uncharacterized protein with PQ loop repeat
MAVCIYGNYSPNYSAIIILLITKFKLTYYPILTANGIFGMVELILNYERGVE